MDQPTAPFGQLLRRWRQQRGWSQLALSLRSEVSARHLSWLESGKASPSRAMVLRLAEHLDVPPRERNALLAAAGYAPLFRERPLDDPRLAPARQALQRLLDAHEPWPALAVDRHWNLVAANRMLPLLLQFLPATLLAPPLNVLRLSLHPQGLAGMIDNLPAWRDHVLARLARQVAASGDAVLAALHAELAALPAPEPAAAAGPAATGAPAGQAPGRAAPGMSGAAAGEVATVDDLVVPLRLHTPLGRLDFITTVTTFGAPHELTLAELAVETLLPADAATAARLQALHATLPPR
ncbi:MAG: helix-turn-helix transcriptional regulator [Rubrivivax sp.]|nr:helix-turn-helix transcriptional regulator [Rubrivivax sp.]